LRAFHYRLAVLARHGTHYLAFEPLLPLYKRAAEFILTV